MNKIQLLLCFGKLQFKSQDPSRIKMMYSMSLCFQFQFFGLCNLGCIACCVQIILIDKSFLTTAIAMIGHKQREAG